MKYRLICADVLEGLGRLEDESVDCVVTSPPYFGLRDYGTAKWEGGSQDCPHMPSNTTHNRGIGTSTLSGGKNHTGHKQEGFRDQCAHCGARRIDNQIGLEESPDAYAANLVEVFREVWRVLKTDGTCWLNLGDSYSSIGRSVQHASPKGTAGQNRKRIERQVEWGNGRHGNFSWTLPGGIKPKDLIGIPWMVAFALRADGWYLRSEIIWHKLAPMPESIGDRPTKAHEQVFLLAKNQRYYYNADAIREPYVGLTQHDQTGQGYIAPGQTPQRGNRATSHKGSSFTQGKTGVNGLGRVSEAEREDNPAGRNRRSVWTLGPESFEGAHFAVMPEALVEPCILAGCPEGGTTLDPFCGSGTVGAVSLLHRRNFIGIDLNPDYIRMARERIYQASSPLLEDTEVA